MTTVEQARASRKRWRVRRRAAGLSWLCIAANHATCRGWLGRLTQGTQRQPCRCRCHGQEP